MHIPESERSAIEKCIGNIVNKIQLRDTLPQLIENLQKKYFNIKNGGLKDKLNWNDERLAITQTTYK